MSLVRLSSVTKQYDSTLVLREAYLRLSEEDRLGLIGKNGSGKTTILRLILGQEAPTDGTVEVDPGVRIGYFSQFSELSGDLTIEEALTSLFVEIQAIENELLEIEIALDDGPGEPDLGQLVARQAALFEAMKQREGWTYQNRIDTVLSRLGFTDALSQDGRRMIYRSQSGPTVEAAFYVCARSESLPRAQVASTTISPETACWLWPAATGLSIGSGRSWGLRPGT